MVKVHRHHYVYCNTTAAMLLVDSLNTQLSSKRRWRGPESQEMGESRAAWKNKSHGNEVLPQDTTHRHTETTLPTRTSVPRSNRQSDHTKTSRPSLKRRELKWYGHVSRSSGLTKTVLQGTGGRQNKTRQAEKRGWKTTPGNGQAWGSQSPRGQRRTEKNGENWL